MTRWILAGVLAAASVALTAAGCTGDDPKLTEVVVIDGGVTLTDGAPPDVVSGDQDAGVEASVPLGTRRACERSPRLAAAPGDRVLFEPYGILVDGAGGLVGWEDTITKKVAVPVDPARRATVSGCCLSVGPGGGLAFPDGPELAVGRSDFSVYAQIKRTTSALPEASGGSAIVKKPSGAFPFVGFALFMARRDPASGVVDEPSFQLQYDPQIAVGRSVPVPAAQPLVVAGSRQGQMRFRVGDGQYSRTREAEDGLSLDNTEPLYLGGGGDNHFTGELCAVVLNVGDETVFETRANEIGALVH